MIAILQQIVNLTSHLSGLNMPKLARWIRCLLQLALTTKKEIAEHLLDQVLIIARSSDQTYPYEELEWLATTTFNRAIDFYCASQDGDCIAWAGKAMEIADLSSDGRVLRSLLEDKYKGLKLG